MAEIRPNDVLLYVNGMVYWYICIYIYWYIYGILVYIYMVYGIFVVCMD